MFFMDSSLLKYPNKSHRKSINIPKESANLAELLGIVFGDGGINNGWQLVISLNSIADREYSVYVDNLIKKLFKIETSIRKRPNQNTLTITSSSTTLVDFLISKGAVRGNKITQQIDIPKWINNNEEYRKLFVRGLVDTDGCLYIHKHKVSNKQYNNIGFCFTSLSKSLIASVAKIINEAGIKPYITDYGKRIYLYSSKSIGNYLGIFGSSNSRILNKYTEWQKISKLIP